MLKAGSPPGIIKIVSDAVNGRSTAADTARKLEDMHELTVMLLYLKRSFRTSDVMASKESELEYEAACIIGRAPNDITLCPVIL